MNDLQTTGLMERRASASVVTCDHGLSAVLSPGLFSHVPEPLRSSRKGRGVPFPPLMRGRRVALLRCGDGFDALVLSKLVGAEGSVVAFDADEEAVARAEQWHASAARALGYSNVSFVSGPVAQLPLSSASFDLVLSNCALSLWAQPRLAFEQIRRILAQGGEFFLSEVVADRRVPRRFLYRPEYAPCLVKASYVEDLRRAMQAADFPDVRTVWQRPLERIEQVRLSAVTLRGFKLPLEDRCEDYGQFVVYRGTIEGLPEAFDLDLGHSFKRLDMHKVCKNTADMLRAPQYEPHFEVSPEHVHRGVFDCGPTNGKQTDEDTIGLGQPGVCGPGCC
jgi:arsenite methyltransferase